MKLPTKPLVFFGPTSHISPGKTKVFTTLSTSTSLLPFLLPSSYYMKNENK